MPLLTATQVAAVLRLHRRQRPRPHGLPAVVAVDGPSGSGKTTLARRLSAALADTGAVPVVALEDAYPGWDGLEAAVPRLVTSVLAPLASGERPVLLPTWDWDRDAEGEPRVVLPSGAAPAWVVVEGVGSGATACAPHLAALLWVEAPEAVRHARAMARDGETYAPHWDRWAAQEAAHFARERTRQRADLVLVTGPEMASWPAAGPR